MNSTPNIALVILNWNGKHFLKQFLPNILNSLLSNAFVVVADNASTDNSVEFLKKNFPQVQLILFEKNMGYAGGYNQALKQINATYFMLLNTDVEVTDNWLLPLYNLLQNNTAIAAAQPKILDFNQKNKFEYAGGAGGWIDQFGYPFVKGRVLNEIETDFGQYNEPTPLFWASGAALFLRSTAFFEAGCFDAYFFAHQEEIDLCWRMQNLGYEIYSCPQSIVYHVGGGSLPKTNSLKTYLNFRNNRIMLSKNLSWQKKIWVMPVRNVLDLFSSFKGLVSGDVGFTLAVYKAILGHYNWLFFKKK